VQFDATNTARERERRKAERFRGEGGGEEREVGL
jgi:hypothetical protein